MADRPTYNGVFDEIFSAIQKMNNIERDETESPELLEFAQKWYKAMPLDGVWKDFSKKEQIEVARQKRKDKIDLVMSQRNTLVERLMELYYDKDLHHLRNKLARCMLWKSQRAKANLGTIKARFF